MSLPKPNEPNAFQAPKDGKAFEVAGLGGQELQIWVGMAAIFGPGLELVSSLLLSFHPTLESSISIFSFYFYYLLQIFYLFVLLLVSSTDLLPPRAFRLLSKFPSAAGCSNP